MRTGAPERTGDVLQYAMDFVADGPVGIFSGRPWCAHAEGCPQEIQAMRRKLPLDFPVSDALVNVLACRGVTSTANLDRFFYPSLDQLHDPFDLQEMDRAVDRVLQAAARGEKVAVHGDFDVDGLTGAALLAETLGAVRHQGSAIRTEPAFVPDRATDGYGVAGRMIREWASRGVTLLLTVDTGSAAATEIALAGDLGMDVVVLDHHIFEERPQAVALVNPRRDGGTYANLELSGVGVAFKFAEALSLREPGCLPEDFLVSVLDLAALGLVADQMSLVGENRLLVKKGLERFNDREHIRPGLSALLEVSGLDRGFPVTTSDFAYQLAPRLNACGRIGRVMSALELLLTRDPAVARRLAAEADRTNSRRKEQDQLLKEEAIAMALPFVQRGEPGLVLAASNWHKGIIGIGAARLVEQYRLPVILIAIEGDEARGSARSVPHIDVKAVLDQCAKHLVRHGGHAQAAGMTLRRRDIDAFRTDFLAALGEQPATGPLPEGYDLDLPLDTLETTDVARLVRELEHLEPFGAGNRKPVFRCCGLRLQRPPTSLSGGAHLRFAFRGPARGNGGTPALGREFVSFGCGESWRQMLAREELRPRDLLDRTWDILFQIGRSTYRPRSGAYDPVQQLLVDIRPGAEP
ncbi:MAG: single-stranded-DNA-specific exonuclease RecJ [bacterium]|nr:single-stranded-DNA-specific exonuclease RecJ [bacterium]